MDFLVGIIGLVLGLAVCFSGLRLFFIMLPIWGFLAGFLIGAGGITALFGDGFLSSTLGFVTGIIVGLVFSVISYLFWYVGVVLSAGMAGGILGAALFATLGIDSSWLLFFIGVAFGAVFIAGAFIIAYPIYLVIFNTALAGAAITIGGFLLVINRLDREEIGTGATWEKISDNWFLWIVWIVIAGIGIGSQLTSIKNALLPEDRWTKAQPGTAV